MGWGCLCMTMAPWSRLAEYDAGIGQAEVDRRLAEVMSRDFAVTERVVSCI